MRKNPNSKRQLKIRVKDLEEVILILEQNKEDIKKELIDLETAIFGQPKFRGNSVSGDSVLVGNEEALWFNPDTDKIISLRKLIGKFWIKRKNR